MFEAFFPHRWRIRFVSRYRSQIFAYRHVIIPAVTYKRLFASLSPISIKKRLRRAHLLWFRRIKEFACRDLWLPSPQCNSLDVKYASLRRCLYCRPTQLVYYWRDNESQLRLCGRRSLCPFCSARAAEDLYRRVSRTIKILQKRGIFALATCRVETFVVKAENFEEMGWDVTNVYSNARMLRQLLKIEQARYKKIHRQLRKQTFGSIWAVVVNPISDGWEIQIRQFFITRLKAKKPTNRAYKNSSIFLHSAKLSNFKDTMGVLGLFVQYPTGLITGYAELSAAVFHARNRLRLSNATGYLYNRGRKPAPKTETPPVIIPFIP